MDLGFPPFSARSTPLGTVQGLVFPRKLQEKGGCSSQPGLRGTETSHPCSVAFVACGSPVPQYLPEISGDPEHQKWPYGWKRNLELTLKYPNSILSKPDGVSLRKSRERLGLASDVTAEDSECCPSLSPLPQNKYPGFTGLAYTSRLYPFIVSACSST